ncbi:MULTISPECIES: hypothetical protein [Saliphagus]|uniref:Uncharacterized protein n=1 Tax=Saliphagus infecundisoli TaxID=1849069 RepID=A0ABD5QB78_9EURY|nr:MULTISPECIES: hypothetical protein [Saliphagus]
MSSNLPDPQEVNVDDLQTLIENMPEEKRQQLMSQLDLGDMGGSNIGL